MQQALICQRANSERKPGNPARGARENICIRDGRPLGLPSAKGASGSASGRGTGFSPLKVNLRGKSILEVLGKQGSDEILGSEALQMEAILFLYDILSPLSCFKDKDTFSEQSSLSQVVGFLIESLEKIIGERWDFSRENGKLSIQGVRLYEQQSNRFYAIPLSFLPKYKAVSPLLHDLIVGMAGLLYKNKGILLWEEDEAQAIEYFRQELRYNRQEIDKEYAGEMRKEVKLYMKGEAKEYERLIKKSKLKKQEITGSLGRFVAQDEQEQQVCEWIRSGLQLLDYPHSMQDFIHPAYFSDHADEYPVIPTRYMRFVWQSDGLVMDNILECMNADCGEWGDVPLSWKINLEKRGDLSEQYPVFPQKLIEFFDKGVQLAESLESSFR